MKNENMVKKVVRTNVAPVLVIGWMLCSAVHAAPQFAENSKEIIQQLKASQNVGKTRSLVQPKTRGIRVAVKGRSGPVNKVVQVGEDAVERAVKLKVEFDLDSSHLRTNAYPLLNQLAIALQDSYLADKAVCINGHTDSDGEAEYNLRLSYYRADSVRNYLISASGIKKERMTVLGFGESMPLVPNSDLFNKQKNRRVEVTLECNE